MTTLFVLSVIEPSPLFRGMMQRVLFEVSAGVFVGRLSKRNIDKIWDEAVRHCRVAVGVFVAKNEAGFLCRTHGDSSREVVDNYGIQLIRLMDRKHQKCPASEESSAGA
ncbi:type I-E CRISPR-associated endoribonuclease Cas2 [Acidithiobacillus ferriphilus]|uniref:type I-E CRISPR-associated endoribonuclease Cas2e n=1 Tax=Acidithiobacillus ferriphilus TaxID=1689834 RepID=UPI001C062C5E|nr:type I-E CRISPR-associated endoribonuclease Cas2 [Acidithiobacillus ferriphilus]